MMSIKHKLIELNDIHDLFMEIQNDKLKYSLMYKLKEELESIINNYDSLYFKAHTNRKYRKNLIRNTDNERHNTIIQTHQTINAFMPYVLLYNLNSIAQ